MRALWSDRQIFSHSVSQKVKRIRHSCEIISVILQNEFLLEFRDVIVIRGFLQEVLQLRKIHSAGIEKSNCSLDPVKAYILRGTPRTHAIKTRGLRPATRQLDNQKGPPLRATGGL